MSDVDLEDKDEHWRTLTCWQIFELATKFSIPLWLESPYAMGFFEIDMRESSNVLKPNTHLLRMRNNNGTFKYEVSKTDFKDEKIEVSGFYFKEGERFNTILKHTVLTNMTKWTIIMNGPNVNAMKIMSAYLRWIEKKNIPFVKKQDRRFEYLQEILNRPSLKITHWNDGIKDDFRRILYNMCLMRNTKMNQEYDLIMNVIRKHKREDSAFDLQI